MTMAQGFFKVGVTFLLCWVCKTKFYNSMADTRVGVGFIFKRFELGSESWKKPCDFNQFLGMGGAKNLEPLMLISNKGLVKA